MHNMYKNVYEMDTQYALECVESIYLAMLFRVSIKGIDLWCGRYRMPYDIVDGKRIHNMDEIKYWAYDRGNLLRAALGTPPGEFFAFNDD